MLGWTGSVFMAEAEPHLIKVRYEPFLSPLYILLLVAPAALAVIGVAVSIEYAIRWYRHRSISVSPQPAEPE